MSIEGWEELESTNTAGKRKKSAKQAEPDTDQEQQLPDAETQPAEKQPEPMPRVITRICARSEIWRQDQIINHLELEGYQHYESHSLGGNEIALRFRKRDK
jgi:hypothetical protein